MIRRDFLKRSSGLALLLGTSRHYSSILDNTPEIETLTILHTNDVHSRIDPFPMDGGKYQGKGGVAKRAEIIKEIRSQEKNVLLLDAGDIFQGTYYFNLFKGEPELKLMTLLKYDASTLGNHDFDNGIEGFVSQRHHAKFPFVNCNYDVSNTKLNGLLEKFIIIKKSGIKIGITGVGVELDGLVPKDNIEGLMYLDPVACANEQALILKEKHKCDLVICLSHLGYSYETKQISDLKLASQSKNIDIIIGGHTHTFLDVPTKVNNLDKKPVIINQVGYAGILLGRIDIKFEKSKSPECVYCKPIEIH
ncbi:MAG: metallophosphoesterase [Saprospiraceae bacterium]|nr:metallophosphoesterase [Saprospiraceae bacterium]